MTHGGEKHRLAHFFLPRLTRRERGIRARWSGFVVAAACAFCLSGCAPGGPQTPSAADAEKNDEQDAAQFEAPLELGVPTPLLSESLVDVDDGKSLKLAKPGHWTATVQLMESTDADIDGVTRLRAVDARDRPIPLAHTRYQLTATRPAPLAKGQLRRIESEILVPPLADRPRIEATLSTRNGATLGGRRQARWAMMPAHQYFLVVLAKEAPRFAYLKATRSITAPYAAEDEASAPNYRVALAEEGKQLPLPADALSWSGIAYVVWDDMDPERLTTDQQQALVDWLHWGGRLIVSGPNSLATLRNSFLARYLPADPGESQKVDAESLARFNEVWTQRDDGERIEALAPERPWIGIKLNVRSGARPLTGTTGLAYEMDVGAGSVVVTAISLTERELVNWSGFDSFLNGALLRRPRRLFDYETEGAWTGLQTTWEVDRRRTRDAHFTTPVRWLARDLGAVANADPEASPTVAVKAADTGAQRSAFAPANQPGGLGQWSDFGTVATAARDALVAAAGVRVPGAGFVIGCLAAYLAVLVPLNWAVFRALDRVEWAWIAAPILAVAGTVVIVQQAQLDIGFVRSHTEISLLELYGDYPRGHLSRFTGLYSSLSTVYDLEFDDHSAVAAPFPPRADYQPPIGDAPLVASLDKYDRPVLRGIATSSASTQLVHSEEMISLAGPIRLTMPGSDAHLLQVENHSGFDIADAAVVRRRVDEAGKSAYEACWIGKVAAGAVAMLHWSPLELEAGELPFAKERKQAAAVDPQRRLDVDGLLQLAFESPADDDPLQGRRDEYRLVARIDEPLPGSRSQPAASQKRGACVAVVHLRLGPPRETGPDVNSPQDVEP